MTGTGDTGFHTCFHDQFLRLTEVSARIFLREFVQILQQAIEVEDANVSFLNDRGEALTEAQFIPPTFEGDADEIADLVVRQHSLSNIHAVFEDSHRRLTGGLLDLCSHEGVLEDFLTLIESKLSGIRFEIDCLNTKETEDGSS